MKRSLLLAFSCMLLHVGFSQTIDPDQVLFYLPFENSIDNEATDTTVVFTEQDGNAEISYTDEGVFGAAGVFDYSPLLSDGLDFDEANSFTLACWVKLDNIDTDHTILHQQNEGDNTGRIYLEVYHNSDAIFSSFTCGVRIDDTTTIESDTWYHLASVKDADEGTRILYVNGVNVGETEIGDESDEGEFVIGARKDLSESYALNGQLDDMIFTTEVLDSAAISELMNAGAETLLTVDEEEETSAISTSKSTSIQGIYYNNGTIKVFSDQNLESAQVSLLNITGQKIRYSNLTTSGKTATLNASPSQGVYFLMMELNGSICSEKFIVK